MSALLARRDLPSPAPLLRRIQAIGSSGAMATLAPFRQTTMMDKSQDSRLQFGVVSATDIARTFIAGVRRLLLLVFCGAKGQTKY